MKTLKSIRIDNNLIAAINELAEKERRTFSNQVECLLEDALKPNYSVEITDSGETKVKMVASRDVANAPKKKLTRFIPPTVDDVRGYCVAKGYTFDPEAFIAHYESNGWKVGKNKMKSWKAACTTWSKRDSGASHGKQSKSAYQQRVEAGDERSFNIDTDF